MEIKKRTNGRVEITYHPGSTLLNPVKMFDGRLTLFYDSMKETVRAIKGAGLRERGRIMIGGGQVTEKVRDYTGTEAFGGAAITAVRLCRQWIGGT